MVKHIQTANRILQALSNQSSQRLLARHEQVELTHGDLLGEPGKQMQHIYFPNSGIVSLSIPVSNDANAEVGIVGKEGVAGVAIFLGVGISPMRMLVQDSGTAMRIEAAAFRREVADSPALQRGLNRYLYGFMAQVAQNAGCNCFHHIEARLARRLLETRDRITSDDLHFTHEFLADKLGVRRAGITLAACVLQKKGLIRYSRGKIAILDRAGLEDAACACYRVVNEICGYASITSPIQPRRAS